jgi:hypothetical protein
MAAHLSVLGPDGEPAWHIRQPHDVSADVPGSGLCSARESDPVGI